MACKAATAAVLRALPPPAHPKYRPPQPAKTAEEIWREINWWTLGTIKEALKELLDDARIMPALKDDGEIGFRVAAAADRADLLRLLREEGKNHEPV